MQRGKAFRRHQSQRIFNKLKAIPRMWFYQYEMSSGRMTKKEAMARIDKQLRHMVNTRPLCSCIGCGNQRKWEGQTRQERKNQLEMEEQMIESDRWIKS